MIKSEVPKWKVMPSHLVLSQPQSWTEDKQRNSFAPQHCWCWMCTTRFSRDTDGFILAAQCLPTQQSGAFTYRKINFILSSLPVFVSVQQHILSKTQRFTRWWVCEWSPAQWLEKATTNPLKDNACVSVYIIIYIHVCDCVCVRLVLAWVEQHFQ